MALVIREVGTDEGTLSVKTLHSSVLQTDRLPGTSPLTNNYRRMLLKRRESKTFSLAGVSAARSYPLTPTEYFSDIRVGVAASAAQNPLCGLLLKANSCLIMTLVSREFPPKISSMRRQRRVHSIHWVRHVASNEYAMDGNWGCWRAGERG
jgi:hypothetical protein